MSEGEKLRKIDVALVYTICPVCRKKIYSTSEGTLKDKLVEHLNSGCLKT
jgi:hypothetical protein